MQGGGGGMRRGGGMSFETEKKNYIIPAGEAREIKIISDERPANISINTNISHNLPTSHNFNFSKIDNTISDTTSGIYPINPDVFKPNPNEIIIDNEDPGFRTIASNNRHKLKDLFKKKDDGKFLDANETLTPSQLAQNKKIYDSSSELKKYRNRKSFSDNQIEMPVVYEKKEDDFEAKVASLKASLLASKQSHYENNDYSNMVNKTADVDIYTKPQQEVAEEVKDDATFITETLDYIPYQKRITPPNIEINVSDENLPAPMRDSKLEPTYNDMVSKIMEKKAENIEKPKEVKVQKVVESFADYESLKNFYNNHGLEFKEYKHTVVERMHNTNFLKFISSIILFALSGIGCALIYWLTSATGNLMATSNFLYYTVPAIFAVYAIILFIRYKCMVSRKASIKYNAIINWVVFLLASVVVFVLNICFDMTAETMASYLTSLLVPICALLIIFPINYYTTKIIYKKYAK